MTAKHKKSKKTKKSEHAKSTHKKEHHKKHKKSKSHKRPKSKKKNYVLAVAVFIVLVAVVYGIIVLLGKAGTARAEQEVAAYVNGEPIMMEELDEQYSRIPPQYQLYLSKAVLLNQTINEELLLQKAEEEGITVTKDEVMDKIKEAMNQAGLTVDDLRQKLAEQNLSEKFLSDLYRKQLTINKLLEQKVFPDLGVTEAEARQYYDSRIRAAHILVEDETEAGELVLELEKAPTDLLTQKFFELAEERSVDPSAAENKGDLGEFSRGMMVPAFEDAAFDLEEGEFTLEPVQTQFGYHIILRLPKEQSFDDQKSDIMDFLLTQKKSQAAPLYINQLREDADIRILYEGEPSDSGSGSSGSGLSGLEPVSLPQE